MGFDSGLSRGAPRQYFTYWSREFQIFKIPQRQAKKLEEMKPRSEKKMMAEEPATEEKMMAEEPATVTPRLRLLARDKGTPRADDQKNFNLKPTDAEEGPP